MPSLVQRLRATLRRTQPVVLVKRGGFHAFRPKGRPSALPMAGLTKRLQATVFSAGKVPPPMRVSSGAGVGGSSPASWRGARGGLRRGKAIDQQVTRLVNGSGGRSEHPLSRMVGQAMAMGGMKPLLAQRGVAAEEEGVATAIDILAMDAERRLVVIELKCGFVGNRRSPVLHRGSEANLRPPFANLRDCAQHRHLAQLASTRAMLLREASTTLHELAAEGLSCKGEAGVRGVLLYIDPRGAELVELSTAWKRRGEQILSACRRGGV